MHVSPRGRGDASSAAAHPATRRALIIYSVLRGETINRTVVQLGTAWSTVRRVLDDAGVTPAVHAKHRAKPKPSPDEDPPDPPPAAPARAVPVVRGPERMRTMPDPIRWWDKCEHGETAEMCTRCNRKAAA